MKKEYEKSILIFLLLIISLSCSKSYYKTHVCYERLPRTVEKTDKCYCLYLSKYETEELDSIINLVSHYTNLIKLNLDDQMLEKFPEGILDLKKLQVLILSNNLLSSIPKEIKKLSELQGLHLYNNNIKSLPVEISSLKKLRVLIIARNLFSYEEIERIKCLVPDSCFVYFDDHIVEKPPYNCP